MLREMLGLSERLMQQLHDDHEKVDGLFAKTLKASGERRAELFRQLRSELEAHALAEERVLYKRLQKSKEEETRKFAYEAGAEHGVVHGLLDELSRMRNKASEQWEAKLTVLQELIHHHVQEEESEGFSLTRSECDKAELEKMADQFEREKERQL
jgi:hemerythrin superfamily protein